MVAQGQIWIGVSCSPRSGMTGCELPHASKLIALVGVAGAVQGCGYRSHSHGVASYSSCISLLRTFLTPCHHMSQSYVCQFLLSLY